MKKDGWVMGIREDVGTLVGQVVFGELFVVGGCQNAVAERMGTLVGQVVCFAVGLFMELDIGSVGGLSCASNNSR